MTSPGPRTLGLIAGNGRLPLVLAEAARTRGVRLAAVAINEETDPAIEARVPEIAWFHVGQLTGMIDFLKAAGCSEVVMAGQLRLGHVFGDWEALMADPLVLDLLARVADRRGDSLLGAVAEVLEKAGLHLREATHLLDEYVAKPGALTKRAPTGEEQEDVAFGWRIAKAISGLAVGQTVVVKRRAVVAVEAVEGTDAAIRRGGELGGEGVVVVKVSRPDQDLRFDLPVIGASTVDALIAAGAGALALEAGRTLVLDREEICRRADEAGIAIVAMDSPPANS
ncbi:MAG: LpxI family protein [Myxococcota bacterium]